MDRCCWCNRHHYGIPCCSRPPSLLKREIVRRTPPQPWSSQTPGRTSISNASSLTSCLVLVLLHGRSGFPASIRDAACRTRFPEDGEHFLLLLAVQLSHPVLL